MHVSCNWNRYAPISVNTAVYTGHEIVRTHERFTHATDVISECTAALLLTVVLLMCWFHNADRLDKMFP